MQGDTGRWESYPRQHAVGGDEASDSVSDSISNSRMDSISDGGRDSIRVSDSDGGSGSVSDIPLSPSPPCTSSHWSLICNFVQMGRSTPAFITHL